MVKIKVLQIISYMYPAISGNGQTAFDISNCLNDEEYEQKIICFNTSNFVDVHDAHNTETVYDKLGNIDVIRCGVWRNIASQLISFSFPKELKKVLDSFAPDIVVLHCPNPFLAEFTLQNARKRRFKLVLYWHSDIVKQKILGKLFYFQNNALLSRCTKVVTTSPNYIDGSEYLSKHRDKCVVVPSCIREDKNIATEESNKLAADLKQKYKNKIICFALGRHVPYKGFDYLIQSSKYLDNRFEIFIGSEGPLTNELKELAKDDSKVHFTGRLTSDQLRAFYQSADIFCFSSITKNEAYGLALADALYYGIPAVTYTIPGSGVNYVSLDGVTGIECPNRDFKAYAKAMNELADDSELRKQLGKNGMKRARELFLYSNFSQNIKALFHEVNTI